jgi:hypothetical protein
MDRINVDTERCERMGWLPVDLYLREEIWKLIEKAARRTGKTENDIVCDLVRIAMAYSPDEKKTIRFDPYSELWRSQFIEHMALKHLRVN